MTEQRVSWVGSWKEEYRNDWVYWQGEDGHWYMNIPGCGIANLTSHFVENDNDGLISVQPSIEVTGHDEAGNTVVRHGYLTKSVWRDC